MKWYHWLSVPLATASFGVVVGGWLYSPNTMMLVLVAGGVSVIWGAAILVSAVAHALVNRSMHQPRQDRAEPAPQALEGQYRAAPPAEQEFFIDGRSSGSSVSGYLPAASTMQQQAGYRQNERSW